MKSQQHTSDNELIQKVIAMAQDIRLQGEKILKHIHQLKHENQVLKLENESYKAQVTEMTSILVNIDGQEIQNQIQQLKAENQNQKEQIYLLTETNRELQSLIEEYIKSGMSRVQ